MYLFFTYFWHLKITNRAFKKFPGNFPVSHYYRWLWTSHKSFCWLWTCHNQNSHFANFEQVKKYFADFEQAKKKPNSKTPMGKTGYLSLGKPIDSYWFKMSCLTCLVFSCVYCFFRKAMKFIQRYLFCMNKLYFCRNFFLTDWRHKRLKKYNRSIVILRRILLWIFGKWPMHLLFCLGHCFMSPALHPGFSDLWGSPPVLSSTPTLGFFSFFWMHRHPVF